MGAVPASVHVLASADWKHLSLEHAKNTPSANTTELATAATSGEPSVVMVHVAPSVLVAIAGGPFAQPVPPVTKRSFPNATLVQLVCAWLKSCQSIASSLTLISPSS